MNPLSMQGTGVVHCPTHRRSSAMWNWQRGTGSSVSDRGPWRGCSWYEMDATSTVSWMKSDVLLGY